MRRNGAAGDRQRGERADAPLTLGKAAEVWRALRDLIWNAEPEARLVAQEAAATLPGPPGSPTDVEPAPGGQRGETDDDSSDCA